MRYVGNGRWIAGIPASDLTAGQVERYGGLEYLVRTTLYVAMEADNGFTTIQSDRRAGYKIPTEDSDSEGNDAGDTIDLGLASAESPGGDAE